MKEVKIGAFCEKSIEVSRECLAKTVGSGDLEVFATPMMIALMENAAAECLSEFLDEGETSVGTYVGVDHISATPLGMEVFAKAEIKASNGREVEFSVEAFDEKGKIGGGTHKRFVVLAEKFQQKTNAKLDA